jgi:hypothetical protein
MFKVFLRENPLFLAFGLFLVSPSAFATRPIATVTPGVLCTSHDPDFAEYRYPEKIAYCGRNISRDEKLRVAQLYGGIPESEWPKYEFDHLIPLAAGGSNDVGNLWPQPLAEAHEKDKVEDEVFHGMEAGTMTQAQAVQKIRDWINQH